MLDKSKLILDNVKYMIDVKQISMADALYQGERELRNEVLLRPIGMPDFGWEMNDRESLHFVAVKGTAVIGCVLLHLEEGGESARLMQMAVDSNFQKKGIGKKLVDLLIATAQSRGLKEITCHARGNAAEFYSKMDFEFYDEPFYEVGMKHFHMKYKLEKRSKLSSEK